MSEIADAIKKIAKKPAAIDIGKAVNVREDKALCDVEIAGKATALDARLTMDKENSCYVVPKEGSDVVVAWIDGVVPVVVSVAKAEKVIWKGEDFFEKMNEFINDYKSHTHELTPSLTAPSGPVTGTISVAKPSSSVEEFKD